MDKPVSLSVKQFIIRKMAVSLMTPEKTIEAVVNHQFGAMLDAMRIVDSVELSGFGKFFFNRVKGARRLKAFVESRINCEKILLKDITMQRRNNIEEKVKRLTIVIDNLKTKMNETL